MLIEPLETRAEAKTWYDGTFTASHKTPAFPPVYPSVTRGYIRYRRAQAPRTVLEAEQGGKKQTWLILCVLGCTDTLLEDIK